MSKYDDMSDQDINHQVACIVLDVGGWSWNEDRETFYHCGIDGDGYYEETVPDYCNNPSDAWPIIIENKISIRYAGILDTDWVSRTIHTPRVFDKNPLRAAMIVFLMMKEAE